MKSISRLVRRYCGFILLVACCASCQDEMDKHYEVPGWINGNAEEVLLEKGNYSLFLKAAERTGYMDMVKGKGIITVVAPSDEAFTKWLQKKNYGSIEDVPLQELTKVLTYHLVYYSYSKDMLANYRPEGVSNTSASDNSAGLYYKFRTKSSETTSTFTDPTTAPNAPAQEVKVYHKERFLPVFSSYLFATKGIDASYNYSYFYPESRWTGSGGNFCVSNASVEEYAINASNGYVYLVDQVLEPLETIHTELRNNAAYSDFLRMYDRFSEFTYDSDLSFNYGNGDSLHLYYHTGLPKIASEWTYNGEGGMPDYTNLARLSRDAYNVFAPTNESLQAFFNQYWAGYYPSLDSVNFIPVKYLLDNHTYQGDLVFPEEIKNGKLASPYGDPFNFDPDAASFKKICVNGALYGISQLMIPRMFTNVTAPLFQDPQYNIMLDMMSSANLITPLMSNDIQVNLFLPNDNVIIGSSVLSREISYEITNPNKYGGQRIMIEGDENPVAMGTHNKSYFARNHISTDLVSSIGNQKVYKTMIPFEYLLVVNDETIYSTATYNGNKPATIEKIQDADNGVSYKITGDEPIPLLPEESNFKYVSTTVVNSPAEPWYLYAFLLKSAGYMATTPMFSFLSENKFVALIPTYEAIMAGYSSIPLSNTSQLAEYLKYYFIDITESGMDDYPFAGTGIDRQVSSFRQKTPGTRGQLKIVDTGSSLRIEDATGKSVNVIGIFPNIYSDGAVYMIDGLLDFE